MTCSPAGCSCRKIKNTRQRLRLGVRVSFNRQLVYQKCLQLTMPSMVDGIHVVSTETIPGFIIKDQLGVVSGSTVRAKNVVRDFTQMLKNIVGGELPQYTELLVESRNEAFTRMVADAKARGANGVVNLRFATSAVSPGAAELFCYGTAVVTE